MGYPVPGQTYEVPFNPAGFCTICHQRDDRHSAVCPVYLRDLHKKWDRDAKWSKAWKRSLLRDEAQLQERRAQIFVMHANGIPYREIALAVGISAQRVAKINRQTVTRIEDAWTKTFRHLQRRADAARQRRRRDADDIVLDRCWAL